MGVIIDPDEPFIAFGGAIIVSFASFVDCAPFIESDEAIIESLSLCEPDDESLMLCADEIIAIAANNVASRTMRFIRSYLLEEFAAACAVGVGRVLNVLPLWTSYESNLTKLSRKDKESGSLIVQALLHSSGESI